MFDAPHSRTRQPRKQPMPIKQRIAVLLLSLLALAPPYAMPRVSATPAVEEGGAEEERMHQEKVNREIAAFRAAQLSLRQAMRIAEKRHSGSRTADISFDAAAGSPVYRVKTVQDNRLWEHTIDARTGDVGAETASHLSDLNSDDRSNLIALRAIRQELSDAVVIAEQIASGKAIGGGLMEENGKLNFVIVVVSGGSDLKQVVLEPPQARSKGTNRRVGSR